MKIENIHEGLRSDVTALLEAGITVHVRIWKHVRTERLGHQYVYLTKGGEPGVLILELADFWRLAEANKLSTPVKPNRVYGSGVIFDQRRDETMVEAVTRGLASGTVVPRFVGDHPPVPVETLPESVEEVTL